MSDAEIVTRVLAGSTDRFAELVERYLPMVRGLCASHIRTPAAQEDLVQDVFVYAFEKLDRLRDYGRFGPWLARITRSKCNDWLRSEKRRLDARESLRERPAETRPADARTILMQREMCEWVRSQIGHLPDKTREAMFLRYGEGFSIADTARFLDIRESAVKKRLEYGRRLIGDRVIGEFGERVKEAQTLQALEELGKRVMAALPLGAVPWKVAVSTGGGGVLAGLATAKGVLIATAILACAALSVWKFRSGEQPSEPPALVAIDLADGVELEGVRSGQNSGEDANEHIGESKNDTVPGTLMITAKYSIPPLAQGEAGVERPVANADLVLIPQTYDLDYFRSIYDIRGLDAETLEVLSKWYYHCPPRSAAETLEFLAKLGLTEDKMGKLWNEAEGSHSFWLNRIFRLFPKAPSSAWIEARTGRDGQARVTNLRPGRYLILLRQSGDGRSWDLLERAPTSTNQNVAFVRAGECSEVSLLADDWVSRVHGKVIDAETSEPMHGMNIKITGDATGGHEFVTSTQEDGTFSVLETWRIGFGSLRLELEPPVLEYTFPYELPEPVESERKMGVPAPEILLKLYKGALITGIVTDPDGTPLEGVHIQREYPDKRSAMSLATTDAQGRYRVKHDGGVYRIRAAASFWVDIVAEETVARTDWAELQLARGDSVVQDFVLPRTGRLVLNFVFPDSDAQPTGVFTGEVVKYGSTTEVQVAPYGAGLVDGKIVIPYLTPGRYEVEARVEWHGRPGPHEAGLKVGGYDPVMLDNIVIGTDGGDTETTVTLVPSTLRQKVRVLRADGRPWVGIHVLAVEYYPFNAAGGDLIQGGNLSGLTGGRTDRNGEYVLENLWEGMFRIAAYDRRLPNYGLGVMVQLPHDGPIILQPEVERPRVPYAVKPIDLASGTFLNTQEHSARVFAIGEQGHLEDGPATNGVTLPEGAHLVVFVKPGYTAGMQWVDVAPPTSLLDHRDIELELTEGGSVYGVVETATGKPLSGQELLVYPAQIWDLAQWDSESWQRLGRALAQGVTSGEAGEFELRFLPTGTYIVACDEHTFAEPVEVRDGYQTGSVIITKEE